MRIEATYPEATPFTGHERAQANADTNGDGHVGYTDHFAWSGGGATFASSGGTSPQLRTGTFNGVGGVTLTVVVVQGAANGIVYAAGTGGAPDTLTITVTPITAPPTSSI